MMANLRRSTFLLAASALLGCGAAIARDPTTYHTEFRFEARFFGEKSTTVVVPRGQVIQPTDATHPDRVYQHVVLCEDLTLVFDADGKSAPVTTFGRCGATGVAPPTAGVTWDITDYARDPGFCQAPRGWYPLVGDRERWACTSTSIDDCKSEFEQSWVERYGTVFSEDEYIRTYVPQSGQLWVIFTRR